MNFCGKVYKSATIEDLFEVVFTAESVPRSIYQEQEQMFGYFGVKTN
jgi:hypothetical protein